MNFSKLAKGLGVILTGGVIAVSVLTWTGKADLNAVKDILNQKQGKLELFQENETQLISKVQALKSEVAGVNSELEELKAQAVQDKKKIQDLENEKTELLNRIQEPETQSEGMINQEEAEGLRNEITRLEGELTKANEDARTLKEYAEGLEEILPQDISGVIGDDEVVGGSPVITPTLDYRDNLSVSELNEFLTNNGKNPVVTYFKVSGGKAEIKTSLYELNEDTQMLIDGIKGIPAGSEITGASGATLYTWN